MYILLFVAAFILGAGLTALFLYAAMRTSNRRQRKRRAVPKAEAPRKPRKVEFVKIIVFVVLLTYFVGVYIGAKIVFIDFSQLGVLLAFIGTPTAAAIGFYCWKAKAENIIKIKKDNPEETEGIPVDVNNIMP